ncbi:single-stranded DNA-binding protein [Pigeon adenovirus 1]
MKSARKRSAASEQPTPGNKMARKQQQQQRDPPRRGIVYESSSEEEEAALDAEVAAATAAGPAKGVDRFAPLEHASQKAMGLIERICDHLDVKWQGADAQPDSAIWNKMAATFMRKRRPEYRLTFSSFDSFYSQFGRFLAAMVYADVGLDPKFTPGGCFVWEHGWEDDEPLLPKCMHGQSMVSKPRTLELNPASESGKRAVAEQNAQLEKNRFGRTVAVLRYENNVVCFRDASASVAHNAHAAGSCGLAFSDGAKALSAMKHDLAWTLALYPQADAASLRRHVLLCSACHCNYGVEGPIPGRQLCRMTPYRLSGAADITKEMCKSRADMRAHRDHPHTMVYTCCNPQQTAGAAGGAGGRGKGGAAGGAGGSVKTAEKSCAWRLSAMDLRYAYVFAQELMQSVFERSFPAQLLAFRWHDGFAYKADVFNAVTPLTSTDPFA